MCDSHPTLPGDAIVHRQRQSYHCISSISSMPLDTTDSYTSPTSQLGLYVRSASAHFDWVMIIATQ